VYNGALHHSRVLDHPDVAHRATDQCGGHQEEQASLNTPEARNEDGYRGIVRSVYKEIATID